MTPENMARAFEITHNELKPFETSDRRLGLSAVRAANRTVTALAIADLLAPDAESPHAEGDPALAEVERLAFDLYQAQDALAFVGECCDIADRNGTPVTTALVRGWREGAKCGRQILAERAVRDDELARLRAEIARVRAVADEWGEPGHCGWVSASVLVRQLRTALDGPDAEGARDV